MKIFITVICFLQLTAQAAPANKPAVMDFEADVIEGQKKAPELFLQLDSEKTELNSILFDRKNFNDFVPLTKIKPLYSEPKKIGR